MKMPTIKIAPEYELPKPMQLECKSPPVPRFDSRQLFGQGKSVHIEHEGKVYELRVTRLGKLILTA